MIDTKELSLAELRKQDKNYVEQMKIADESIDLVYAIDDVLKGLQIFEVEDDELIESLTDLKQFHLDILPFTVQLANKNLIQAPRPVPSTYEFEGEIHDVNLFWWES